MKNHHHTIGHYPVRMQDCDPTRRIHLHRLFDFAQDADDQNCALYGIQSVDLHPRGLCWILISHASSFTGALPRGEDMLIVDSWTRGTRGVRFLRENRYYKNTLDDAHYFGSATSEWIICTRGDHRPLRPSDVMDTEKFNNDRDASVGLFDKIPRLLADDSIWQMGEHHTHEVVLSDLDTNTHLHSACYLRLAIDQLGRHRALDPAQDMLIVNAIHLQYIQEVNFGQRLLIASKNTEDDPDAFLVEGRVEGADNPSFLARLEGRIVAR